VNQISPEDECATLRQMLELDFSEPLEVLGWPAQIDPRAIGRVYPISEHPSRWQRLMRWTPTDAQLRHAAAWLRRAGRDLDLAVKAAVLFAAGYLIGEVIWAFWPGHVVSRVLGGLR
jgi:hypothetical protein